MEAIDPNTVEAYFNSEQALSLRHKELASLIQSKSAKEKVAENLIAEYKTIPTNYPARSSILKIAARDIDTGDVAKLFEAHPNTVIKARKSQLNAFHMKQQVKGL